MGPILFADCLVALWLLVRCGPGEWREDPDKNSTAWN